MNLEEIKNRQSTRDSYCGYTGLIIQHGIDTKDINWLIAEVEFLQEEVDKFVEERC